MPRCLLIALSALTVVAVAGARARAATPLSALRYAADITVDLNGTILTPAEIGEDDFVGTVTPVDVGPLPPDVHIDGYVLLGGGAQLLSFDTTVALPGGVTAEPADVVRFAGGSYSIAFDAAEQGIPADVNVDAVTVVDGDLVLSFDVTLRLDGVTFEDEDLVRMIAGEYVPFFIGAAADVPPDLDLDGAQVIGPQSLLVSFDGSGNLDGVDFDDNDVLEFNAASSVWELAYQGAGQYPGWDPGDLVAPYAFLAVPSPTPTPTGVTPATAIQTPTATHTATSTATGVSATATATATATVTSTAGATSPTASPTATSPSATATPTDSTPGSATPTGAPTGTATGTPLVTATTTVSPPLTPTTPSEVCVGDCNGNGVVTVDELIIGVNISLGTQPIDRCPAFDPNQTGTVTIEELIQGVNNLLNGCP